METYIKNKFGESGVTEVNFYVGSDSLAVSDNHRMAYYYFAKNGVDNSHLIHIDSHADFALICEDCLNAFRANPDVLKCPENFINLNCVNSQQKAVSWGNWIPTLRDIYPKLITSAHVYLHKEVPIVKNAWSEAKFFTKSYEFNVIPPSSTSTTLYSFDIDYYFNCIGDFCELRIEEHRALEHFQETLFLVKQAPDCLPFIALSPTCCGGWENTLPFTRIIDEVFDTKITNIIESRI
ncbi:MAG: hypothetical protein CME32_09195 [Gimesia sp.]|nr:hypothetical protein [Gimesia sp.]